MAGQLSAARHLARAARHEKVGNALAEAGDEWAAVCYFYAAYHTVKAAILEDTIFDDPLVCSKLSPDLLPEDRFTSRHQGRRRTFSGGREWGVNELVLLLYRSVVGDYERLHQASNDVRYHDGLRASVEEIRLTYQRFVTGCSAGGLSSAFTKG